MDCDAARRIVTARASRAWPPDVSPHLLDCDPCAIVLVEHVLQQRPSIDPAPGFADHVAIQALRDGARPAQRRRGWSVPLAAAVTGVAAIGVWATGLDAFSIGAELSWSTALMLAAFGEAAVLMAWMAQSDSLHIRTRQSHRS